MAQSSPVRWRTVVITGVGVAVVAAAVIAAYAPAAGGKGSSTDRNQSSAPTGPVVQHFSKGCTFRSKFAVLCATGRNAVDAFGIFGYDSEAMSQPYARASLHESGCFLAPAKSDIRERAHGKIAFVNGWASVTAVVVNGVYDGIVDDDYLNGKCEKVLPPTKIQYSLPTR